MNKQTKASKPTRRQYTPQYRSEALALAERVGIPEAARQLGIDSPLLYNWRKTARIAQGSAAVESAQAAEIARLKRQLADQAEEMAILKKASAYFARQLK